MYLIKTHYTATDANTNFKGEEQTWYNGKGEYTVSKDSFPTKLQFDTFGYKTKASVTRAFNMKKMLAENEEKYGTWKIDVSLVEM